VKGIASSVSDPETIARAVRGAEVVFLLVTGGGARWDDFERDVVEGTRRVLRACRDHGVRRVVYTSSIAALYLGEAGTATEDAGPDPQPDRRSLYSRAKIAAEHIVRDGDVGWVIFRPGVVMGRDGVLNHAGLGLWPSDVCCIGWGDGTTPLPLVLVEDVARAMAAAVDAPVDGQTFNLAGDVRLTARECVALMAEHSLRPFRFYPMHPLRAQAVDILKWLVKIAARKPENAFPSYRDLRSNMLLTQLDCSRAKNLLGWSPNAEREVFVREALLAHLTAVPPSDLRSDPAHSCL
jgi:nucleoside-diphosphate-sugar epimerase